MAGILELSRERYQIKRELLRRIGYTNGLHDVYRFARVVEYLYPLITSTNTIFQSVIIEEEKNISGISGKKYSQGIVDVAGSLLLINKVGRKLFLSDRGYALHTLEHRDDKEIYRSAFLLMCVLDADGEYFLNLLDMVREGVSETIKLGRDLLDRMLKIIELKERWGNACIDSSIAQDIVLESLHEARRVLKNAIDPSQKILMKRRTTPEKNGLLPDERVERFLEHTVVPRLEWLTDLGCARKDDNGNRVVTKRGERLLVFFKDAKCWRDGVYLLPLSDWLANILDAENLADAKNLFWRSVAMAVAGHVEPFIPEDRELLDSIKKIYPYVRLHDFNEAEISSIFHVLSCVKSVSGQYIQENQFDENIISLVESFPGEIFRLSKRRGRGGYIALKERREPKTTTV